MDKVVLIVDDYPDLRDVIRDYFDLLHGVRVVTASNAKEGISAFRGNLEIGVIICDRRMGGPGLDGEDLHCALADEIRERAVHFVLLHADDGFELDYFNQVKDVTLVQKPLHDIDGFVGQIVQRLRPSPSGTV